MKRVLFNVLIVLLAFIFFQCQKYKLSRPNPVEVSYQELIEKNYEYSVYKNCTYELAKISYDTIPNRKLSALEIPSSVEPKPVPDRVDLNEILKPLCECEGEYEDVDLNYTKLTPQCLQYLDSLGIYWDGDLGCYRKRK